MSYDYNPLIIIYYNDFERNTPKDHNDILYYTINLHTFTPYVISSLVPIVIFIFKSVYSIS